MNDPREVNEAKHQAHCTCVQPAAEKADGLAHVSCRALPHAARVLSPYQPPRRYLHERSRLAVLGQLHISLSLCSLSSSFLNTPFPSLNYQKLKLQDAMSSSLSRTKSCNACKAWEISFARSRCPKAQKDECRDECALSTTSSRTYKRSRLSLTSFLGTTSLF
jgi:hypothetical protein